MFCLSHSQVMSNGCKAKTQSAFTIKCCYFSEFITQGDCGER